MRSCGSSTITPPGLSGRLLPSFTTERVLLEWDRSNGLTAVSFPAFPANDRGGLVAECRFMGPVVKGAVLHVSFGFTLSHALPQSGWLHHLQNRTPQLISAAIIRA